MASNQTTQAEAGYAALRVYHKHFIKNPPTENDPNVAEFLKQEAHDIVNDIDYANPPHASAERTLFADVVVSINDAIQNYNQRRQ